MCQNWMNKKMSDLEKKRDGAGKYGRIFEAQIQGFQQCTVQWHNSAAPLMNVLDFERAQGERYGNTETEVENMSSLVDNMRFVMSTLHWVCQPSTTAYWVLSIAGSLYLTSTPPSWVSASFDQYRCQLSSYRNLNLFCRGNGGSWYSLNIEQEIKISIYAYRVWWWQWVRLIVETPTRPQWR